MLIARAGASAIAAALALSPIHAAAPKPIVDLSKSPAVSGKAATSSPKQTPRAKPTIGPVEQQTAELGGGAIALLALGAGAFAISRSRRRRREAAQWNDNSTELEAPDPLFEEPMFRHKPAMLQPAATTEVSAFAGGKEQPCNNPSDDGSDRCPGESWVERAYRGPSPANPSVSLKARLKRAAFFDKRERDVAAGRAAPVDTDAGLPETMVDDQERELA